MIIMMKNSNNSNNNDNDDNDDMIMVMISGLFIRIEDCFIRLLYHTFEAKSRTINWI